MAPYVDDRPAAAPFPTSMTSQPSSYTPLESLLLFQALRNQHNKLDDSFSFNRISNQLKSIPIIHDDASYDSGRLSPDALRDLYLSLLKEEVKRDLERQLERANDVSNGDGASRKRKAPSPPLPTVREAAQHSHLIPQLVARLYAAYREKTVKEVREYERKYDALQRDIEEIEAGKWDERLKSQKATSITHSPKPSTFAHTQPAAARPPVIQSIAPGTVSPASPSLQPDSSAHAQTKPYTQAKIDAVINHVPEHSNSADEHRRTSSNTTLPPLSEMAPQSPRFGIPPKMPGPMSHMQQPQYSHPSPPAHQPTYAPHHAHPAPGPPLQNNHSRPPSRHEVSPRPILPPPLGMKLPPPTGPQNVTSPGMHGPPMAHQQPYQIQHRTSMGPSPNHNGLPPGYPSHLSHPPQGYYPQSPYPERCTSYAPPQGPPIQGFPSQAQARAAALSGYQSQPFMMDSGQVSGSPSQKQPIVPPQHPLVQGQTPVHTPGPPVYHQYPNVPSTAPPQPAQASVGLMSNILAALGTPTKVGHQKPLWKSERRPPPLSMPNPPPPPEVEPLSPVLQRALPARSTRRRKAAPEESSGREPVLQTTEKRSRRRPRAGSPSSVTSSTIGDFARGHTRSHSVSTAGGANMPSDDRPGSRGGVKIEPSTPAEGLDTFEHVPDSSANPASGPLTRKRRGTLQSQPQPPSKRKRQESPAATPADDADVDGTPPPRPNTIMATRNFAKVASAIMNDLQSHKHASYFSHPVRDKDATGYSEIIKYPQHLKSIKAAITAGARAVAAATSSSLESPGASVNTPTTGPTNVKSNADGSTAVELPRAEELMPPKAIVNGAQLEKEVYRMFANAVMFNPGGDGLVADTREMFEDVEGKMKEWRGAEEEEGKAKRRKA